MQNQDHHGGTSGRERGGPGHELRNLVQVVSGYLELLASRTEDALLLHYIETAQAAAREIAELAERVDQGARG